MQSLISEIQIRDAVAHLARRINTDYRGRSLTIVGVLTGSLILVADLVRRLELPVRIELIRASSYRGTALSPGDLAISVPERLEISGRDVLLVDDIFDTGKTLEEVRQHLESFQPASLKSAVLLWKEGRQRVEITPDYHCFRIPDVFVVGYGLDFNDEYRQLPYIAVLNEPIQQSLYPV